VTDGARERARIWSEVLTRLESDGVSAQQRAFLTGSELKGLLDDTALIAVPTDYAKTMLETRIRVPVEQALAHALEQPTKVAVTVDPSLDVEEEPASEPIAPEPRTGPVTLFDALDDEPAPRNAASPRHTQQPEKVELTRLNPKYLFDTFVIGASNRFAHAAAVAVAEAPAKAYNPLFIYGESGLGKTHLLHAIGHYARSLYPHVKVRYVNSEEFTNDFINSIRDDRRRTSRAATAKSTSCSSTTSSSSRARCRPRRSSSTPSTRCTTPTSRSSSPATSRPKQLSGFEERMVSRFEWGLLTDVQPPDLETRIAILRKKAIQERLTRARRGPGVHRLRISTNIRELEGALIRVTAFASLNRQPVDLPLTQIVLQGPDARRDANQITSGDDHGPDRGLLRPDHRRSPRRLPLAGAGDGPADRDVPLPGAHRPLACRRSASSSAAATTRRSCTPTRRSAS
jgi:chromosomal replication initiator protein